MLIFIFEIIFLILPKFSILSFSFTLKLLQRFLPEYFGYLNKFTEIIISLHFACILLHTEIGVDIISAIVFIIFEIVPTSWKILVRNMYKFASWHNED